jgi:hypothetical protein
MTPEHKDGGGAGSELLYRKKPVVVEAVRWTGKVIEPSPVPSWISESINMVPGELGSLVRIGDVVHLCSLEGEMKAQPGDWIIRGVKGELYPCKPDIFAATYEPASAPVVAPVQPWRFTTGTLHGKEDESWMEPHPEGQWYARADVDAVLASAGTQVLEATGSDFMGLSFAEARRIILDMPLETARGMAISLLIQNNFLRSASPQSCVAPSKGEMTDAAKEPDPTGCRWRPCTHPDCSCTRAAGVKEVDRG